MAKCSLATRRWDAPGSGQAVPRDRSPRPGPTPGCIACVFGTGLVRNLSDVPCVLRDVVPALRRRFGRLALAFKQILFFFSVIKPPLSPGERGLLLFLDLQTG